MVHLFLITDVHITKEMSVTMSITHQSVKLPAIVLMVEQEKYYAV